MKLLPGVAALGLAGLALQAQPAAPDLLIVNARVFTGVTAQPWAEAVAIKGERILAVGDSAEMRALAGPASRVIDAAGRLVIPGINDAHAHGGGSPPHTRLEGPPAFEKDPSLDEVITRIKAAVAKAPAGGWIVGEIGTTVLEDPKATRDLLDPVTGDHPLLLGSWHGHGAIVNTAALRRLKVSDQEPDPPGGFFGRKADGRTLTGLAHEYADYTLRQRLNRLAGRAAQVQAYRDLAAQAVSFGVTSVQVMATDGPITDVAGEIAEADLPIRVRLIDFVMTPMTAWQKPALRRTSGLLRASGTKWIIDGSPIESLMYLREPYSDAPSNRGRLNFPEVEVRQFLARALAAREQPMFHAVGDAAIDMVLAALEGTGGEKWAPLRPRIEHGDMLEPAHFDRAKRMGVVLVQNPSHFMTAPIFGARIGPRASRADIVKTTIEAGVPFAIGSDGPMNPFLNMMFAAINPMNPAETLTVAQSLTAYTSGSAYAEFAEKEKGTIAPGMLADVAMLSQDIFKVAPPELPKTTSLLTVVGGRIVHEAK